MLRFAKHAFHCCCWMFWVVPALAQPGANDASFATGNGFLDPSPTDMALDADGRMVVVGDFTAYHDGLAYASRNRILRLNGNGSLDLTFVVGTGFNAAPLGALVQPDGNIVVWGMFTTYDGSPAPYVVRLLPTGAIDPAFNVGTGPNAYVGHVIMGADDKLMLCGGFTSVNGIARNRIARLNSDGSVDTGFDPVAGFMDDPAQMILSGTNAIVVVGSFTAFNGSTVPGMVRLLDNGTIDNTFAPPLDMDLPPNRIVADGTAGFLVGGSFTTVGGLPSAGIARLGPDGVLDAAFAAVVGSGFDAAPDDIALQPDGSIIVVGDFTQYNGVGRASLARLSSGGALDPTFGSAVGCDNSIADVECLADGRLVFCGGFTGCNALSGFYIDRVHGCLPSNWFLDADGDGFGDPASGSASCYAMPGRIANNTDCDDSDPLVLGPATYYADTDGDGFGDPTAPVSACSAVAGHVLDNSDCDDTDDELPHEWFEDADGDGYGDVTTATVACIAPPGYIENAGDCDIADPLRYEHALCDDGSVHTESDQLDPQCNCNGDASWLNLHVFLQGPFAIATGLMRDDLRTAGVLPTVEPYTSLGYTHAGFGGGEAVTPGVFAVTGNNAIVDWVVVELRDANTPAVVLSTRSCLLQRDGDIVDMDGVGPIAFRYPGNTLVHVAVRHRNHLGAMSAAPVLLINGQRNGVVPVLDLRAPSTAVFGTEARIDLEGNMALWMGDVTGNGQVQYTGTGNDRDPILTRIGGSVPTNVAAGYYKEDVNLNGVVQYTGTGNDRDPLLVNIGGTVPTNIRYDALP